MTAKITIASTNIVDLSCKTRLTFPLHYRPPASRASARSRSLLSIAHQRLGTFAQAVIGRPLQQFAARALARSAPTAVSRAMAPLARS
jgi:hypothetical protein